MDILLDVISGVESLFLFLQEQIKDIIIIINAAGGMSEDHDRCFSMLVLGAFSTGVFQHHDDDDVFYLFLQKQKIGVKLHIYL